MQDIKINNRTISSITNKKELDGIRNGDSFLDVATNIVYLKQSSREITQLSEATVAGEDILGAEVIDQNNETRLSFWVGTQEQLDLVEVKNASTIYMVKAAALSSEL